MRVSPSVARSKKRRAWREFLETPLPVSLLQPNIKPTQVFVSRRSRWRARTGAPGRCRPRSRARATTVSVHLESARSSTSSTGPPGRSPSTSNAPQTLRNCWALFCIPPAAAFSATLRTTSWNGRSSAAASRSANAGTRSGRGHRRHARHPRGRRVRPPPLPDQRARSPSPARRRSTPSSRPAGRHQPTPAAVVHHRSAPGPPAAAPPRRSGPSAPERRQSRGHCCRGSTNRSPAQVLARGHRAPPAADPRPAAIPVHAMHRPHGSAPGSSSWWRRNSIRQPSWCAYSAIASCSCPAQRGDALDALLVVGPRARPCARYLPRSRADGALDLEDLQHRLEPAAADVHRRHRARSATSARRRRPRATTIASACSCGGNAVSMK